jgi:hypothetical protein
MSFNVSDEIILTMAIGVGLLVILTPISLIWEVAVGAIRRELSWPMVGQSAAETCIAILLYWMLMILSPRAGVLNLDWISDVIIAPAGIVLVKLTLKIINLLFHRKSQAACAAFSIGNQWRLILYSCGPGIAVFALLEFRSLMSTAS